MICPRFLLACLALLAVDGCTKKLPSVSGHVTLDGRPLSNAVVLFDPAESGKTNPGPGSSGKTNERGEFTLKQNNNGVNGAVPGKHHVTISALEGPPPAPSEDSGKPRKDRIPAKYRDSLFFDVPADGTTAADFDLKSK
jgi:hypothetical protein